MISIDTAKRLKNLGMQWEPQADDEFVANWPPWAGKEVYDVVASDSPSLKQMGIVVGAKGIYPRDFSYWMPPLDTMLKQFQQKGISWLLLNDTFLVYSHRKINNQHLLRVKNQSQQQAAAEALAWLLQQDGPGSAGSLWESLKQGAQSAAGFLSGNWAWLVGSLALAFANRRR
ncbi:MAG: hypothetical protein HPY50_16525 [Firmicutes bacterium]|nr:hypothetical protein [Bacillota bacterium]